MTLTKRSAVARKRRKKLIRFAKSFQGSNCKLFKPMNQTVMRAFKYSYNDRKKKKRILKKIWIRRINGESRENNLSYNKIIYLFKKQKINLNKKVLAEIITNDQKTFKTLTQLVN